MALAALSVGCPQWVNDLNDRFRPVNPVTKKRQFHLLPESWDIDLGQSAYATLIQAQGGKVNDVVQNRLVNDVGSRLANVSDRPSLPYEFTVIDTDVLNAWCLPGGKIGFNRGLIESLDAEKRDFGVGNFTLEEKVAAVMGHELTHATARHGASRIRFGLLVSTVLRAMQAALCCFLMQDASRRPKDERLNSIAKILFVVFDAFYNFIHTAVVASHSRDNELEADRYGMVYLKRAGYNPRAAIWLQEYFAHAHPHGDVPWLTQKFSNIFRTHPDSKYRAEQNRATEDMLNKGLLV